MNTAFRNTRRMYASFIPITYDSAIPYAQKDDVFKYLGLIKNKPHYVNQYNEVYSRMGFGNMRYEAEWLDEYKMLWTDYPVIYRLITFKEMDYFYDMEHNDAYYYDIDMDLVIPAGYYDRKKHTLSNIQYWGGI